MQENFDAHLPVFTNPYAGITPQMPIPRAIRRVCQAELTTLADMLPVALHGSDIEGVHKVRVTVRRLRTCLKLGKSYFKKSVIQSLRADLKEVGQVFGTVRDMDVLQLGFRQFHSGQETDPEFDQMIWAPAFGHLYAESRAAMRDCAGSQFFSDLQDRLNDFLNPEYGLKSEEVGAELPGSLRLFLTPTMREQLAAMLEFHTSLENPPPYAEFHHLRLQAKAHRYTLEFFQAALNPQPAAQLIESLIALQDHLGELNDCVVAEKLLRLVPEDSLSPEVRQALAGFQAHKAAQRQALTDSFLPKWNSYRNMDPAALISEALQP